jgi:uncharacterized protein YndB with AHSA1/START domain
MDTIKLEKIYNAPIEVVWKAITDRQQMKKWYFDFPEGFKLEVGSWFEWYGGDPEGKQWLHRGRILEFKKNEKLVHSWEYPGYTGISTITWKLVPVDAKTTKLIFSHEFTVPFDPSMDVFNRNNFVQGWDYIINTGLEQFLKK